MEEPTSQELGTAVGFETAPDTTVIQPISGWPTLGLRELWRHRNSRGAYARLAPKEVTADGLHVVESTDAESLMQAVVQAVIDKDSCASTLAEEFAQLDARGGKIERGVERNIWSLILSRL